MTPDLLFGFVLAKLFSNQAQARKPPPAAAPPPPPSGPTTPAALPASPAGASPAPAPAPAPSFPTAVNVPPPATTSKFKKAVEVWQVRPDIQNLKGSPFVVGLVGEVNDATALAALEGNFPTGWAPSKSVTQAERNMAIALTQKWVDGNVVFLGPATLAGRRAFRMTKHPIDAVQPQPAAPQAPPAAVPVATPAPVAPAPVPPPPAPVPVSPVPDVAPPAAQAPTGALETAVRKGEGLAQVGKRLGRAESQQTATELRAANLPAGPGGVAYTKINLSDGGLRRSDRKTGGLQPGDRLFVPASWGAIDPARL
jgi:hypothetical protein